MAAKVGENVREIVEGKEEQVDRRPRQDSSGEDLESLVRGYGRSLRLELATIVDSWQAVLALEATTWQLLGQNLPDASACARVLQQQARAAAVAYLADADRIAIQQRDVLRRLIVQAALDDLRIADPASTIGAQVQQRLAALTPAQRSLLDLHYVRGIAYQTIAVQRNVLPSELALELCLVRSGCDWRSTPSAPVGDRLLPTLTEDLLHDLLDAESRALLSVSIAQDLMRGTRLERQVRIHLVLRALLGPFSDADVHRILATSMVRGDSPRSQASSAYSSNRTRVRSSDVVKSHISNRRPAAQSAGLPPWLIGGVLAVVMVGTACLVWSSRSTVSVTTAIAKPITTPSVATTTQVEDRVSAAPVPTPGVSALRPQQLTPTISSPTAAPTKKANEDVVALTQVTQVAAPFASAAPVAPDKISPARTTPVLAVESLSLINADTDQAIPGYESLPKDVTLRLSQLPTRHLNLAFHAPPAVASIHFKLPGCTLRADGIEKGRPFALSNDGRNYKAWTPKVGSYTLTVTAYADHEQRKTGETRIWSLHFEE